MKLSRPHLTVLLNALHDLGETTIPVSHPSDQVGELIRIDLGDPDDSAVSVTLDADDYASERGRVANQHGSPAVDDLPERRSYVSAFVAGGLVGFGNQSEVEAFVDTHGGRDLNAGHNPILAGFDTNLMAWRVADALGLSPGRDAPVNGYALATGVRDELDWDRKRSNTDPLVEAFGPEFEDVWNQPAGANREGRLGVTYYRHLRDHRYSEEVVSERGDEAIVKAYETFEREGDKDVMLFSNDRDFVERARSKRVLAQRVEFPRELPSTVTGSWTEIQDALYVLTVLFGVLTLPKVTLYGVWTGKEGIDWQRERLKVDCRSPKARPILERDVEILKAYEESAVGW